MGHFLTWESIGKYLWVIGLFVVVLVIAILLLTDYIRPLIDNLTGRIGKNPLFG